MRAITISVTALVIPLCVACGGGTTVEVEPETPESQEVVLEPASTPTEEVEVEPTEDVEIERSVEPGSTEIEVESD